MTRRRGLLVVLAIGLLVTGCEGEDLQILIDMAFIWAQENAIDIAKYGITGSSGNDEVDAIMDARGVIQNVNAADQLMEQARLDHLRGEPDAIEKMQQAVELRPGDYTYRVSLSTALLRDGDVTGAAEERDAAMAALGEYGPGHVQAAAAQEVEELEGMEYYFGWAGFESVAQCQAYYDRLSEAYGTLGDQTNERGYFDQAVYYRSMERSCTDE